MNIPHAEWSSTDRVVQDDHGKLWRIIGFIDRPAVILDPIIEPDAVTGEDSRQRKVEIMGSETSKRFTRLLPEKRS